MQKVRLSLLPEAKWRRGTPYLHHPGGWQWAGWLFAYVTIILSTHYLPGSSPQREEGVSLALRAAIHKLTSLLWKG
jgi:hypothetical protein